MAKKSKKEIDREVDAEFEAKKKEELLAEFASSQALHVPATKRENVLISIRLPVSMIQKLREIAIQKGDIGYQQMIKTYIAEGILKDSQKVQAVPSHPFLATDRSGTSSHVDVIFVGEQKTISGNDAKIA